MDQITNIIFYISLEEKKISFATRSNYALVLALPHTFFLTVMDHQRVMLHFLDSRKYYRFIDNFTNEINNNFILHDHLGISFFCHCEFHKTSLIIIKSIILRSNFLRTIKLIIFPLKFIISTKIFFVLLKLYFFLFT